MKTRKLKYYSFLFIFWHSFLFAQNQDLNWENQRFFGVDTFSLKSNLFYSDYSYLNDSAYIERLNDITKQYKNRFFNHIFSNDIISKRTKDYTIISNPTSEGVIGISNLRKDIINRQNKGFNLLVHFGDKIEIVSGAYNGFEISEKYINDYSLNTGIYPGFGGIKEDGRYVDYLIGYGHINWRMSKYSSLSAGHGKHKIGDGYRSVLLSDAASNYPYIRFQLNIWKFNYSFITAQFTRFGSAINSANLRQRKNGSFHYLEANLFKKLKLTFFEAVIWAQDSLGLRGIEMNYLNPFVPLRPVEFAIGSPDNVLIGGGLTYLFSKKAKFYSQFILDELKVSELFSSKGWWANKYALQVGVDLIDPIGIKGLRMLSEYNLVRPFTYTHFDVNQNYGHMFQSLAHPSGANFMEFVNQITLRKKSYIFSHNFIWKSQGMEESDLYTVGSDVNVSYLLRQNDYGNNLGQGRFLRSFYNEVKVGYIINPRLKAIVEIGYSNRIQTMIGRQVNEHTLTFGIRTQVFNTYRDF